MKNLVAAALIGAAATIAAGTAAHAVEGVKAGVGGATKPVSADPHLIDGREDGAGTAGQGINAGSGSTKPV
jgi:hypothetical protein